MFHVKHYEKEVQGCRIFYTLYHMNIKLHINKSPSNKVDKNIDDGTVYHAHIKHGSSLLNPTMVIGTDIRDIVQFNYAYIGAWNRYYYITNMNSEKGLTTIEMKCDSLMSHKDDILNSTQNIARQETRKNNYLYDHMLPQKATHTLIGRAFGLPITEENDRRIVLKTIGRG